MTDQEVIDALRSDTPLNRVRRELSAAIGRAEQAERQRRPPGPIERRRQEFEAARRIAAVLGVTL
jgi:hypothetical protein